MQRLRILCFALLTMFALSAIASATASALPTLLNSSGELILVVEKYTGESGLTEFWKLNGNVIKCLKSTATGQFDADSVLGLFHINFKECKGTVSGISAPCTGENDVKEEVLVLGEAHLVYDTLKPVLGAAVLFLIPQFHFTCGPVLGINVLILVRGSVLCLIKPIEKLTKHFEIVCEQGKPKNGDPGETRYWADPKEGKEAKEENIAEGLLGSESTEKAGEKFEMSAELGTGLILTELEVIIMA